MLGDLKFLDSLREFDKDNIAPANIRRIREKYVTNPEFNPDIIKNVSSACEGLCRWVLAIEVYDKVIKVSNGVVYKVIKAINDGMVYCMKRLL